MGKGMVGTASLMAAQHGQMGAMRQPRPHRRQLRWSVFLPCYALVDEDRMLAGTTRRV